MRSDMTSASTAVSTRSDAAALQNDLAQRFNLSNVVRPTQKVILPLNPLFTSHSFLVT